MKPARVVLGIAVLLMGSGLGWAGDSQEAAQPDISLTVTETLNHLTAGAPTRDDLREIPAPRVDRLSDAVRVTVTVGDPRCLPGEDDWVVPQRLDRGPSRRAR